MRVALSAMGRDGEPVSGALGRPLAAEFERELGATRELLRRLPDARLGWRPHPRSMALGRLASHVVEIARYGSLVLATERLDSTRRSKGPLELDSSAALLACLETYAHDFLAALVGAGDERLMEPWRYCKGDRVIFEVSRLEALRTFVLNHWYHHRGQLTVYLRLLDVSLPQIYGPTADDGEGY
jgi:uncharacterized damage-inducible protein DinB